MVTYMRACHNLMDRIDYSDKFETSRVKIAVLDTGIDWSDSYILGAKDRIADWKNWAGDLQDRDSKQQVHDNAGHGTHVTSLLLKTAPEAQLYVCRIANQNGAIVSPKKIAEVSLPTHSSTLLKYLPLFPVRSFSIPRY
jgi:subtilisin family serine protease